MDGWQYIYFGVVITIKIERKMANMNERFDDQTLLALDYALDEAMQKLSSMHELCPFLVMCDASGMYVSDHDYEDAQQMYQSMAQALTDMEYCSYIAVYDGQIDTDDGVVDAITCEYAAKQDAVSQVFALPYTFENDEFVFSDGIGEVGNAENLFSL